MRPETTFVYVTYIATTPDKLWEALTTGAFTCQYWGGRRIESNWQVGAPVRHIQEDGSLDWHGEVLVADPPHRLAYTFDVSKTEGSCELDAPALDEAAKSEKPSRVTFEIELFMDQVKLTVTHDQFEPGSKVLAGVRQGWPAILSGLKSLLEVGEPLFPAWR